MPGCMSLGEFESLSARRQWLIFEALQEHIDDHNELNGPEAGKERNE
jgi:hypothetical protein